MARWRLQKAHYLNIEGVEWEHKETNVDSGRQAVRRYKVPMLLDPDDKSCLNRDGDCIVAYAGSELRGDHIFEGVPTWDMEPLDKEAEKIQAELGPKIDPVEGFNIQNSDALLAALTAKLDRLFSQPNNAIPVTTSGVSQEDFGKLQAQFAELMAQNQALQKRLEAAPSPRRV